MSELKCAYCGDSRPTAEEMATHVTECIKSPLVQMVKEMEARCADYMDLMCDEFTRIENLTDSPEIKGICQRSRFIIHQKEHVIDQRDRAVASLIRIAHRIEAEILETEGSMIYARDAGDWDRYRALNGRKTGLLWVKEIL